MTIEHLILLALVGCIAGFINVLAGGGSLIVMPSLLFLGLDGTQANGTNRVAILLQNISAVVGFMRHGFSDFKLSLSLALCTLPGVVFGAYLGTELKGIWFNRILAIIMVCVLVLMYFQQRKSNKRKAKSLLGASPSKTVLTSHQPQHRILSHALMLVVGFYGGFIQAGVGFIIIAVLSRTLGLDLARVNMHKVFIVAVYTVVALAIFAWRDNVIWKVGLALAIGNSIGGLLGAKLSVLKGDKFIYLILNIVLIAMVIKLVF